MSTICVQSTKRILGTTLLSPCLSSILTLDSSFQTSGRRQGRSFATRSPGSDPLELLKESSEKRGFCDADGIRKKDVHWTFSISTSGACLESVSDSLMIILLVVGVAIGYVLLLT